MNELTVLAAIEKRRSTKHFRPDPIADTVLNALVDAAAEAPSSWNFQPWRIVLIQSEPQKRALSAAAWNQAQIIEAPVTFVFATSIGSWRAHLPQVVETARAVGAWAPKMASMVEQAAPGFQEALGPRLREYTLKDAMIAATHVALAAESLGLGSCFMNGWIEDDIKRVIGAGDDPDIAIALLLPVGHPAETPSNPGRLPRKRLFSVDRLDNPYQFRPKQLRSPRDMAIGLVHLPRMMDKVRLAARGELPGYNYLTTGFDKYLLELLEVTPAAFEAAIAAAPNDDAAIRWIESNTAAKGLSAQDKEAFNKHILSIGPTDERRRQRFRVLLDETDPARTEVNSFAELIDLSEGRI
ncbi:MAG: nitroreductase family protein [Verrucomicrobiae bacterium]|nr:nitroreductase family protein [Verrucomicrobiae bacterium]